MKKKIYLQISNKTLQVKASYKPVRTPLHNGHYKKTFYPTLLIGLTLNIPDELFLQANEELELNIKMAKFASEVAINLETDPEKENGK